MGEGKRFHGHGAGGVVPSAFSRRVACPGRGRDCCDNRNPDSRDNCSWPFPGSLPRGMCFPASAMQDGLHSNYHAEIVVVVDLVRRLANGTSQRECFKLCLPGW